MNAVMSDHHRDETTKSNPSMPVDMAESSIGYVLAFASKNPTSFVYSDDPQGYGRMDAKLCAFATSPKPPFLKALTHEVHWSLGVICI